MTAVRSERCLFSVNLQVGALGELGFCRANPQVGTKLNRRQPARPLRSTAARPPACTQLARPRGPMPSLSVLRPRDAGGPVRSRLLLRSHDGANRPQNNENEPAHTANSFSSLGRAYVSPGNPGATPVACPVLPGALCWQSDYALWRKFAIVYAKRCLFVPIDTNKHQIELIKYSLGGSRP